jgi:hypothetical protein
MQKFFQNTVSPGGRISKKIILKKLIEFLGKKNFNFFFLHGEKENFEEYSQI